MLDIYDLFMAPYSGYKKRSVMDFELLLDEAASTGGTVLQTENAYVFCDAEENVAAVTELAGEDMEPLLVSLFDRGFQSVRFPLPEDRTIPGVGSVLEPFNMLRIIDAAKFLEGLPAKDGEYIIEITDSDIEDNCGRYMISSKDETIRKAQKISGSVNGPEIHITSLMRLACGSKVTFENSSLSEIFSRGAVNYAFERY
jgi:hypothetical protein